MGWLGYRRALRRPLFRRDQGRARPGNRDRRRRGAALRAEPSRLALPEHAEEDLARFREQREEAEHRRGARARALPLQPRDARPRRSTARASATMRATVEAACAIEADGVVFHVGSHLGAGFEAGFERCVPALARCSTLLGYDLAVLENSAGAGGTIGRSIDELARSSSARPASAARDLPRFLPSLVSGVDVVDPDTVDALSPKWTRGSALTGSARSTSTMRLRRSARTATGTRTSSRATRRAARRLPGPPGRPGPSGRDGDPGPGGHGPDPPRCKSCATSTPVDC